MIRPVAILVGLVVGVIGCNGADPVPTAVPLGEAYVEEGLLATAWPVRMADDAIRGPFENDPGWGKLFERDYAGALAAFEASDNRRGLARVA